VWEEEVRGKGRKWKGGKEGVQVCVYKGPKFHAPATVCLVTPGDEAGRGRKAEFLGKALQRWQCRQVWA